MDLHELGWNEFFASAFPPYEANGCIPARVAVRHKGHYLLYAEEGELRGEITGRLLYLAAGSHDLPTVGDWVAARPRPGEHSASITGVLPRATAFIRRAAGDRDDQQVLASNVEVAFLVNALDTRLSFRGIERYLVVARESGARPVILLNKTDLCTNAEDLAAEVRTLAPDIPVHLLSAKLRTGIEAVQAELGLGITGVLLGPSGVGKSTIFNVLLGVERMQTRGVREYDDRGRHTTTRRELIRVPLCGLLMDTPGMRELQLPEAVENVSDTFEDVEELAASCRFRDCRHEVEPGCAVLRAVESGTLDEGRLRSFQKLQRELEHRRRKVDRGAELKFKQKVKKLASHYKKWYHRGG